MKGRKKKMEKKLYAVEINGVFCFVSDTCDKDNITKEAFKHLDGSIDKILDTVNVHNVTEIKNELDIPWNWTSKNPLGVEEMYEDSPHPDCAAFFENKEDAIRITDGLKKLDYDLEPTFVEDLQRILNDTQLF